MSKMVEAEETGDDSEQDFISLLEEVNHNKTKRGGLAWRNLQVCSVAGLLSLNLWTTSDYLWLPFRSIFAGQAYQQKTILHGLEGLIDPGQLLLVLGAPGSGCSTLLRSLSGQTRGLTISGTSELHFLNAPFASTSATGAFCAYSAEQDEHLPYLSTKDTISFATSSRLGASASRQRSLQATQTLLSTLGLSEVSNTRVGNDFTHGLSGGERRRVSIAELLINNHQFQAWDNSSRGLDISSAKNIIKTLRTMARTTGLSIAIALYQVSDDLFNLFDKVVVLQQGHQIYFGNTTEAVSYFNRRGYIHPSNFPVADYLTSLTVNKRNSATEKDLIEAWQDSDERASLMLAITARIHRAPAAASTRERQQTIYGLDPIHEIGLCFRRALQCLRANKEAPISNLVGNCIMSFILGSLFLNLQENTTSFYGRSVLLFFVSLLNTFLGAFEGVALWGIRPIVEKQRQYGLCRPVDEAIASMLSDIPNKILLTLALNMPMYFLANLNRTGPAFLTFYLFMFFSLLTGSMMFRAIGAFSRTLNESIAPGAIFATLNVIFTGFVLPIPYMPVWLGWFRWLNPIAYAFESLMINEFGGRSFTCTSYIPSGPAYDQIGPLERQCTVLGAQVGASVVEGNAYIAATFDYHVEHLWRNLGAIFAMMILFCALYLLGTHLVRAYQICGEVPVYLSATRKKSSDPEDTAALGSLQFTSVKSDKEGRLGQIGITEAASSEIEGSPSPEGVATLAWNSFSLSIPDKKATRLLLDDIEGYVTSGSLMALMGPSGAGKTSLLNCLADRCSYGKLAGTKVALSDGRYDLMLSEILGYAQQQDIHLTSSTVYEALVFSAMLRQPAKYSNAEKLEWIDKVVDELGIADILHQIVGVPGQGLNIEQRKQLTIAVELAARPKILLLDEPLSGLDSDTAWSICKLLRRLSQRGYAILCTVHQPSARLFETFDQLLYLRNGKTVYCGAIGPQSRDMINYFENHGVRPCRQGENPAEWMFDVTASSAQAPGKIAWHAKWACSPARSSITARVTQMIELQHHATLSFTPSSGKTFAASSWTQLVKVSRRNLLHDWRTPSYLWSKFFTVGGLALLNSLSFLQAPNTLQGIQNQIFSVFIVMTTYSNIAQIIMPQFVANRTLYERREQPSRTYSWWVFVLSNILAEIPMQMFLAVVLFVAWYYPVGFFRNASSTADLVIRGWNVFLVLLSYMLWSSSFAQMVVTIMPDAATGINIASLLDSLALIFSGVLVPARSMPKFWLFMYRVSPATYFISSIISAATGGNDVKIQCASNELVTFNPPSNQTCEQYLASYMQYAGATLNNPLSNHACQVCPLSNTNQALAAIGIDVNNRWRDLGLTFCYTVFNIVAALLLYWLVRVPKYKKSI